MPRDRQVPQNDDELLIAFADLLGELMPEDPEEIDALLVQAGLTPYEALRTGTVNVAVFYKEEDRGRVAPGFVADMVLLNANPLENISNTRKIEGVMRDGEWFDRAWLDKILEGIRERKV